MPYGKREKIMKNFTVQSAVRHILSNSNAEQRNDKLILVKRGTLNGLKACSAFDFIKNHTDINIMMVE